MSSGPPPPPPPHPRSTPPPAASLSAESNLIAGGVAIAVLGIALLAVAKAYAPLEPSEELLAQGRRVWGAEAYATMWGLGWSAIAVGAAMAVWALARLLSGRR